MTAKQRRGPARRMLASDPGPASPFQSRRATGGRDYPQSEFVSRRVQVLATNHPATDRWITLTATRSVTGSHLYVVGVVDGFSRDAEPSREFPTLRRARTHANKLYNAMTEEDR